ncbi:hypothetical protein A9W99_01770 [Mycobacterium sp. 1164966.3]|uniref:hypothetical protein n=1 Tax=Mycobacterium sp. 1164966.3 TaxID=1856861 RepID=UPI0008020F6F|nr:hypothetical protein [Mycobacterium sp. 1164966.3]OBA82450.1 hypothetical protein A9W99_01770 [Mycobacterium sp. 1164966.3]
MNRVRAGIFSLTPPAPADEDYLRWHLLDHMPEQYQLPGIVYGLRWIADGSYRGHRLAADGQLGDVGNAVHYLVSDPVEKTFDDFVTLGRALREKGRFPVRRASLQVAGLRLLQWQSSPRALISAEVVPFRPHRGVLLVVEESVGDRPTQWLRWLHAEHYPALLAVPGTAGAWTFGSTNEWNAASRGWRAEPQYITVVYLDDDPLATTAVLAPLVQERWQSGAVRPVFAGPLRSMISWDAWA